MRFFPILIIGAGLLASVYAARLPVKWFPAAQETPPSTEQQFLEDTQTLIHADSSSQSIALSNRRKEGALTLIAASPSAFLQGAIPAEVKPRLPGVIGQNVEAEITIEGELETTIGDNLDQKTSTINYSLIAANGKKLTLHFAQAPQSDLPTGTKVKAHGFAIDNQMVIESAEPSTDNQEFQILSLPEDTVAPQADVSKTLAVVLLNFDTSPSQPYTVEEIRARTFTDPNSVNAYYREVSNGKLHLRGKLRPDGDVFGWFTVPYDRAIPSCFPQVYQASQAARRQAASAGIDLSGYDHIMFVTPPVPFPCESGGWGMLRGSDSWILGAFETQFGYGVPIHELGHNFGAGHANSIVCFGRDGRPVPISAKCKRLEYDDPFDVMGSIWPPRLMNGFHRGQFNFFTPGNSADVDPALLPPEGSVYTLSPLGPAGGSIRTLRIVRTHDPLVALPRYYYVEYRRPYGAYDNFFPNDPIVGGVTIRISPDYAAILPSRPKTWGDSWLVDASTEDGYFNTLDPVLLPGRTFSDPYRGIAIEALAVSPQWAAVRIKRIPPAPCERAPAAINVSPQTRWGNPGQTVTYKVSVQNNDTFSCGPAEFSVSVQTPSGWSASFDNARLTVDPERTGRAVLSLSSPQGSAEGLFPHQVAVSRPGSENAESTATAQYMVYTVDTVPPSVKIIQPKNNEIVWGSFYIHARAADNVSVDNVTFFLNGQLLQSVSLPDPFFTYLWQTNTVADGPYVLTAKAFDTSGNATLSEPVAVTVQNAPATPTPTVTSTPTPTPLPPVPEPVVNNFTVQAIVQNPDGSQTVFPSVNAVGITRFEDGAGNRLNTYVKYAPCMNGGVLSLPIVAGGAPCSSFAPGRYATQWKATVKVGGSTYTLINPTTCVNKTCSIREQSEMITGGQPIHRGVYQAPAPKPPKAPTAPKTPKAPKTPRKK